MFSRSGFTDGYATGERGLSMFGYRRHEDVTAQAGVLGERRNLYKKELQRVPVNMSFTMKNGAPAALKASDGVRTVTVAGAVPQSAINRPTDSETARANLSKTGGTPFTVKDIGTEIDPGLMIPVSEINRLRRDALDKLLAERETIVPCEKQEYAVPGFPPHTLRETELRGRFRTADQIPEGELFGKIILPATEIFGKPELITQYGDRLICELPTLLFPENE